MADITKPQLGKCRTLEMTKPDEPFTIYKFETALDATKYLINEIGDEVRLGSFSEETLYKKFKMRTGVPGWPFKISSTRKHPD